MEEEILLTKNLCAICHVEPPKYTCPRCKLKTCSLPCSKRHKLQKSCSGERDPTEFRKRTDLQTSLSLDLDYNYLTGIERTLDNAARTTTSQPESSGRFAFSSQQTRKQVTRNGVRQVLAPQGMKRARENKTSWNQKRKALSWTIEWIFLIPSTGDEYKILDDRVPDTDTLSEAAAKHLEKDPLLTAHFSEDAPFALQYLLRDVNSPTTARAYIQLDPEHNFKDNLRNCTVLEFPTIVVARDVPPQYTLVPKPNPQHGHDEAPQTKTEIEEEPRIEDVVSMADVVKSLVKDDLAYVAGMAADDDALVPKIFKEEEGVESSSSSSSSEEEEEEDEEETGVQGKEGTHVQAADPAPLVEESEPCPTQL